MIQAAAAAGAIAGGTVTWLLKAWAQSRLDTSAQKTIAEFRSRLDATAAAVGFAYQRQLQAHNLFVARKYEVVAELYSRVLEAHSEFSRLIRGIRNVPMIADMTAKDAERYMVEHAGLPEGLAHDIVLDWDNRREAVVRFESYLDQMRPENARRACVKANNYRLKHEIYLSDPAAACARDITVTLMRSFDEWDLQGGSNQRILSAVQELNDPIQELKSLLRFDMMTPDFGITGQSASRAEHGEVV